jgi:uncharacterized membrane protein
MNGRRLHLTPLFIYTLFPTFSLLVIARSKFYNQRIRRILSERPHLRNEDKQLLELLIEEQGAAFERDLRKKLLLPKTSVWRLVRQLERQELIEVLKVSSQNLIKLKV